MITPTLAIPEIIHIKKQKIIKNKTNISSHCQLEIMKSEKIPSLKVSSSFESLPPKLKNIPEEINNPQNQMVLFFQIRQNPASAAS